MMSLPLKTAVAVLFLRQTGSELLLNVIAHERRKDVKLHLRVEHRVMTKFRIHFHESRLVSIRLQDVHLKDNDMKSLAM